MMTMTLTLRSRHLSREPPEGEKGIFSGISLLILFCKALYCLAIVFSLKLNFDRGVDNKDPDFEDPADVKKARSMARRNYR